VPSGTLNALSCYSIHFQHSILDSLMVINQKPLRVLLSCPVFWTKRCENMSMDGALRLPRTGFRQLPAVADRMTPFDMSHAIFLQRHLPFSVVGATEVGPR
jgi:hypothetical protein